jgi:hypothetical protein
MALRRLSQDTQRPCDLKSFATRRDDAFLVIQQQQIGFKLDRKGNRRALTKV